MKYNIDRATKGLVKIKITLDEKEWKEYIEKSYEENKVKYTVQGFRKGKAPRAVIEKHYGENTFTQPALDDAFYKSYHEVLEKEPDIEPIETPSVSLSKYSEKEIEMMIEIPVLPDFELGQYKDLEFKMPKNEVTEKQIEDYINKELMRGSKLIDAKRAIEKDDLVTLNFEGFVDGKAFEGGKAENYQLKIGSHTFIDNFEDQLIGLNIEEKKDVEVTFPENYHEKNLAGKKATFKIEIKQIRVRELPKFDEDFVKNTSEFETVEAYKDNIKSIILKEQEMRYKHELENNMIDKIIDNTKLEIPETLIASEQQKLVDSLSNQLGMQGLRLQDYLQYIGKTEEEYKAEQKNYAEKNVRAKFILEKLIKTENIEVKENEFDAKIKEIAELQKTTEKELKEKLNQQEMTRILNTILMDNVMVFLKNNNKIVEK